MRPLKRIPASRAAGRASDWFCLAAETNSEDTQAPLHIQVKTSRAVLSDPSLGSPPETVAISPIALAAGREVMFGVVMDLCDLAASYGRSAAEAAWRGDEATLRTHLADMKSAVIAALMAFNELAAEGAQARAEVQWNRSGCS